MIQVRFRNAYLCTYIFINVRLYLRLPPAELPGTQNPSCSLMVQVEEREAGEFSSTRVSGFTLQSSTTSNRLLKSSALILIETGIYISERIACETQYLHCMYTFNALVLPFYTSSQRQILHFLTALPLDTWQIQLLLWHFSYFLDKNE